MSNVLDDIQVKVATLSAEERAALALRLIESLDAGYPAQTEDWESTWLAECDRRVERYESGEDRGIPLDQALTHARQRLLMRASACGEAGTPAGGGGCRTG